jgi:ribosomal protein L40E
VTARDPSRIRRVRSLRNTSPGWLMVAVCRKCGHAGALPYDRILRRFGELFPAEDALCWLKCAECGAKNPEARSMVGICATTRVAPGSAGGLRTLPASHALGRRDPFAL